jgi:hypothetical protein
MVVFAEPYLLELADLLLDTFVTVRMPDSCGGAVLMVLYPALFFMMKREYRRIPVCENR